MRIANEAMLAVVALFIVVAPIDADAQYLLPPTLTGENLHAQHGELVGGNIGTVTFSAGCGPNSTIDYTITGVATGPYPGTFVESGKIVLGSGIGELGEEPFPIVELSARFTIESITARDRKQNHRSRWRRDFCDLSVLRSWDMPSVHQQRRI